MEALAQVKAALDAGLVNADDYLRCKAAFLRAQQVRFWWNSCMGGAMRGREGAREPNVAAGDSRMNGSAHS
jgi:hypothetical protein